MEELDNGAAAEEATALALLKVDIEVVEQAIVKVDVAVVDVEAPEHEEIEAGVAVEDEEITRAKAEHHHLHQYQRLLPAATHDSYPLLL